MVPEQPTDVHLELVKTGPTGIGLGLRAGDKLVGLNGESFTGGARNLSRHFSTRGDVRVVMHFQRADVDLKVISTTGTLGHWRPCPIGGTPRIAPADPAKMDNWEILRSRNGVYDLFRYRASPLAWMLAPVWLANMRLWPVLGGVTALVLMGWPLGIWAMLVLWALASVFVWRGYAQLIRADRMARGLVPHAVVAAETELEAHLSYLQIEPDDRFLFGNTPELTQPEPPEHAEATA